MNNYEIAESINKVAKLGLAIVEELKSSKILEYFKKGINDSSDNQSAVIDNFQSLDHLNVEENGKIENNKNKRPKKKLFSAESSKRLTRNLYRKKENKPSMEKTSNNKVMEILKPVSLNDQQGPSREVQKKNQKSRFPHKRSSNNRARLKSHERSSRKTNNSLVSQYKVKNRIPCISSPLKMLKDKVDRAVIEKKTFTVCGNYFSIRRALLARGWVEKLRVQHNTYDRKNILHLLSYSVPELLIGLKDPLKRELYKGVIMTKLLGSRQVDFYWDQNYDCFRTCSDRVKYTIINRFRRKKFSHTSKQGLCEAMKYAHWYQNPSVSILRQPRTYKISDEELKDFIKDFNQTAIVCLLKWVTNSIGRGETYQVVSKQGKVSIRAYYFAVKEVLKLLRKLNHEDIDGDIEEPSDYEWELFLDDFYKLVHSCSHFNSGDLENVLEMQQTSTMLLKQLENHFHTLKMDGMMNVWIMKPSNGTRGIGIHLCRTLEYILKTIKANPSRRYIIQKYIERPLLIYKTKFDIRQWFLISCAFPLTLWIYKECYIRFSSQLYSLQLLHESIHLTNNSVQHRYKNCPRSSSLPQCNMWDSKQLQKYLASIGFPVVYRDIIYPGMKESIIAAMLINQHKIDNRYNSYELYGCDFMLSEDFKPWLIEINCNPALFASTPVTARLCPNVLSDIVKVMVDYPKNSTAPTGGFELLYKEQVDNYSAIKANQLFLNGTELPADYFCHDESYDTLVANKLI